MLGPVVSQAPELEGDSLNYKVSGLIAHPRHVSRHRTKPCLWLLSLPSDGALVLNPGGHCHELGRGLPLPSAQLLVSHPFQGNSNSRETSG